MLSGLDWPSFRATPTPYPVTLSELKTELNTVLFGQVGSASEQFPSKDFLSFKMNE